MKEYSETIPIQYQEGYAKFFDMDIIVDPRVLIPRPETELLVEVVTELCVSKKWKSPNILEIGVGTGIISISLSKRIDKVNILGVDVLKSILSLAWENIERHNSEDNIDLRVSDMFSEVKEKGFFNAIVSNPPYISESDYEKLDAWVKAEPRIALFGGKEGLDFLNIIAQEASEYLINGGFLALEIGYNQAEVMKKKLIENNFVNITTYKDFNGYERVIVGWKNG